MCIRDRALADPRFGGVSGADLIAMQAPRGFVRGAAKANGDTVGLTAVSEDGWAVSFVNSVYWAFGAHILEPETGIILSLIHI